MDLGNVPTYYSYLIEALEKKPNNEHARRVIEFLGKNPNSSGPDANAYNQGWAAWTAAYQSQKIPDREKEKILTSIANQVADYILYIYNLPAAVNTSKQACHSDDVFDCEQPAKEPKPFHLKTIQTISLENGGGRSVKKSQKKGTPPSLSKNKVPATYHLTSRKITTKDGKTRAVFTRDGKDFVRRVDKASGHVIYKLANKLAK